MSLTDPIADFITVVRNGVRSRKETVKVPSSKMKAAICRILQSEGFVESWEEVEESNSKGTTFKMLRLHLRYADELKRVSPINQLERISRPGRRVYVGKKEIPRVRGGYGLSILSTSNGVLSDKEARQKRIGGEVLVKVW